jgi:putative phage-type endonuclease
MTAVLIETASEAGWLEARRRGVTASEISVVLGLSPYDSPFALYHRKRGDLPDVDDSDAMERGRILEPYIAGKFAQLHPEFAVEGDGRTLYAHPDRPWQMATPDRLVFEDPCHDCGQPCGDCPWASLPLAVLETKTDAGGDDGWGDEGTDQIPVHYRCQVLWQMDVLGVTAGYVAMLPMRSWKLRVYEIELDDQAREDLLLMRSAALHFLHLIKIGVAPEIDWRPQTTAALKHLHPKVEDRDVTIGRKLAISYRAAVRRAAQAERRKELMTNRMLAAIGTGRRAIEAGTDEVVATRSVYPNRRISTTALRAGYPDAAAACTVTKDVTKLLPARTKKD